MKMGVTKLLPVFLCVLCIMAMAVCGNAAPQVSPVPIPPSEKDLSSETAQKWFTVTPDNDVLEGAIFDADGNLLLCDVSKRQVLRLTPDKELSVLLELPDLAAGGLAFHPDGRLFMAALDLEKGKGAVLALSPSTGQIETIIPIDGGYWPNDLVFAPDGGFYFSNFKRNSATPAGGIYYVSPDFRKITPVIPNLDQANGVALSPDGKILWATEFVQNRLHREVMADPVTITPVGAAVPFHFTGITPDSMRVDKSGNVYVALYGQGRVMVFNDRGLPIRQILLPERENGKNLVSTSLAINPAKDELFVVSSNDEANQPAQIFRSKALSSGLSPLNEREQVSTHE